MWAALSWSSDNLGGIIWLDLLLCDTEMENCKASFMFGGGERWSEGVRKERRGKESGEVEREEKKGEGRE